MRRLIGGAAITLTMSSTGAVLQRVADADGRFVFLAVTPGEYLLAVERRGIHAPRDPVRDRTSRSQDDRRGPRDCRGGHRGGGRRRADGEPGHALSELDDADDGTPGCDADLSEGHAGGCDRQLGAGHDPRARRLRAHSRPRSGAEPADQRRVVLGEHPRGVLGGVEPRCDRDRERDDRWIPCRVRQPVRRRDRHRHPIRFTHAGSRRVDGERRRSRTLACQRRCRRTPRAFRIFRLRIRIRVGALSQSAGACRHSRRGSRRPRVRATRERRGTGRVDPGGGDGRWHAHRHSPDRGRCRLAAAGERAAGHRSANRDRQLDGGVARRRRSRHRDTNDGRGPGCSLPTVR